MCQFCTPSLDMGSNCDLKYELFDHWKKGWSVKDLASAYRLDPLRLEKVLKEMNDKFERVYRRWKIKT